MRRLMRLLAGLLGLFAVSGVSAKPPVDYAGSDGGYLVYSVGTIAIGMQFGFPYRRIALPDGTVVNDWKGEIEPKTGGAFVMKIKNPDFAGRETGHVVVRRLPPGDYAIEQLAFFGGGPMGSYAWSSGVPFRIPFTIRPGGATYIGSFMRAPSAGTSLQPQLGYASFFVIADRSARDLPIARTKKPGLGSETIAVTDVNSFGSAALRTAEP